MRSCDEDRHSVLTRLSIDLDEATLEAGHAREVICEAVEDYVIEPHEQPRVEKALTVLAAYEAVVRSKVGLVLAHDREQKRQAHRIIFGADGAAKRRGLIGFEDDQAA